MLKHGFDKIVRDRIPEIIQAEGRAALTRTLGHDEALVYLERKLREEVEEFSGSHSLQELADILEVVRALASELGSSPADVEKIRRDKQSKNGGFERRVLLVEADVPEEGSVAHETTRDSVRGK
jgi:predicted house-cleaning noncanonical NTP pyrophosphatase (MazG superfamily)